MPIKIFIVDDSAFMRKILTDIFTSDKDLEVIGFARNGKEALEKLSVIKPDVITLDVEMPIMDGITTLEEITKIYKIPVVMLSSLTVEGADSTLRALDIGAVDFITKPSNIFKIDDIDKKQELIDKIKTAAFIKSQYLERIDYNIVKNTKSIKSFTSNSDFSSVIAIGTSTGGPRALQEIIPNFSSNINGTIVVVQHMPPGFTKSLANRLDSISAIKVKEGEDGEVLRKGYCYIAPGDYHMIVSEINNRMVLNLDKSKSVSGHRPSVDVLMSSVSRLRNVRKVGVILTGMGADGAKGIGEIKDSGGYTIAQNEETCVVYGMPKVAINNGAIHNALPLNKIALEIMNKVGV